MGGISTGTISREMQYHGRKANVLRGEVRLENQGGFIQMATNFLVPTDGTTTNSFRTAIPIDATKYTGIELDVHCDVADTFNVQYVCYYFLLIIALVTLKCVLIFLFIVIYPLCFYSLKTTDCGRPQISYRATFDTPTMDGNAPWTNVKIPFSQFYGHATDIPLDVSKLTRIGIVAIGREMHDVQLAIASIRFY